MWKKNDSIRLTIEDLTTEGAGIGKVDGFTFFIKDALIGDEIDARVIKLKKNYGFARLMNIITPSPDRVTPRCPVARSCGGCQIQAMRYDAQLAWKQEKVRQLLERVGHVSDYEMLPIMGMEEPWHYRNKVQYPVGLDKEGRIVTGFYAGRTHAIIDTERCYIQPEINEQILSVVKQWMADEQILPYDENTGKGLVRHVLTRIGFQTGEILVCLVINGQKLPHADPLISKLREIAGMKSISVSPNMSRSNVILGETSRTLWGQDYITDYIGNVKYQISPLSFYQVNPVQTRRLYQTALEFADPGPQDVVWDLYCGIGTISLFIAQKASQVHGVEIVPQAIEDAKRNAALNGMSNAHFYVGKAEEVLPQAYREDHIHADIIVVDPPRKGCDQALLDCMLKMQPAKIVYVSCDPATLARDLRILEEGGYKVKKVRCCDMFPHSIHCEVVTLLQLSNRKPDAKIRIDINLEDYYRIKDSK